MSLFDKYLRTYGKLPRLTLPSGRTVHAANGYLIIEEAGHRLYITREDLPQFLRFAQKTGQMMDQSFDPRLAMQEYLDHEEALLRDRRLQKKSRRVSGRLRFDDPDEVRRLRK